MKEKLKSKEGGAIYKSHKVMVEPMFGNMKFNRGFGQFVLRGLKKVKAEFLLMCIAHNLKKMFRYRCNLRPAKDAKMALKEQLFSLQSMFLSTLRNLMASRKIPGFQFQYVQ